MTTSSIPTDGLRSPKSYGGQPIPENEEARLGAVVGLNQVHSETQPALVALRNTAQRLFQTPVAFIGMIEEETQRLLTVCIAPQGAESTTPTADFKDMVTPRDCSICQYTIMEKDHLVIPDMDAFMRGEVGSDFPEEFRQQASELGGYPIPWPTPDGEIELRPAHFYAGATIRTREGLHIGTFCVVDVVPRPDFGAAQIQILESLAGQAAEYLEDRALLRFPANLRLLQQAGEQQRDASAPSDDGQTRFDAVVLGGGPAGTTAACRLSFQGLRVALVEPKAVFGAPTGINSKVLREVAMEHGSGANWDQIAEIRELIGARDAARIQTQLKRYGVSLIQGRGAIAGVSSETGETTVEVSSGPGEIRRLSTRAAVLSTGSKARRLAHIPFDNECIFDSDSINAIGRKPKSLFIQGTGVIALEYATIFAAMGVDVTIAARGSRERFLPKLDVALRDALVAELEAQGVEVLFECSVEEWERSGDAARLKLSGPSGSTTREFEAAMSAVGRVPATQELGLDSLNSPAQLSEARALEMDERLRLRASTNPIYAVGDISGSGLACQAVVQAQGVVNELLPQLVQGKSSGGSASAPDSSLGTASVVWAIPELAFVGKTEHEASDAFGPSDVVSVITRFADTIRGSLHGLPESYFLKLVCLRQDGRILGVHVYGEGASELIHLGASLVSSAESVFKLQYRTFPAVTLHEIYRNAALQAIDTLSESLRGEP